MQRKLLIVQNIGHEGPGILSDLLIEYDIAAERYDLSKGITAPDPAAYSAMVVLGGPQSANDGSEQIVHELESIRKALDAGVPYLGICLGMQLLVKAAGGDVVRCDHKEVGFREPDGTPFLVQLTPEGKLDELFRGMPEQLEVFQLHGETVIPTPEMTLLATGRGCINQVVRVGAGAWGLQCHFEVTPGMFENWIGIDPDLVAMNREELRRDFEAIRTRYTETGRTILLNFLHFSGLVNN